MSQQERNRYKKPEPPGKSGLATRLIWQLAVAATIFCLWLGIQEEMPETAALWESRLTMLMSATTDLRQACDQLGEDLSQGEDLAVSVGNWCETVFLPQPDETQDEA